MSGVLTNGSDNQLLNDQKKSNEQNILQISIRKVEQSIQYSINKKKNYWLIGILFVLFTSIISSILRKYKYITLKIAFLAQLLVKGYSLIKHIRYNQQLRNETIQDWERLFGLEDFKEINNQPYTKEDLDCVYRQKQIFWNPNKKKVESKRIIAVKRLKQIEKAYQNILNYYNWN